MTSYPAVFCALVFAYLLGSVPFAVLSARLFGLADPRTYGSGNPGATNVLRAGSKKAAFLTLVGDAGKGAAAVYLARAAGLSVEVQALVALSAFLGHLYSLFLRFRGGKGVATAAGVLLALSPVAGGLTLLTWVLTAWVSRYSSLAAVLAAFSAPFWFLLTEEDGTFWAVTGIAVLVLMRHLGNLSRLLAGREGKIGEEKNKR
ncbi:MAG: glycerol-3-phosphate 1-O-acyltransferase PlsY [Zoogloeaceae bacterium]|jgi:glycerol-3-phosphate acyltransferase PlsY|nr:glycerol-3-phosphate 1-O-acyltransferase PlsY [Zoogloeaceae bacterium]